MSELALKLIAENRKSKSTSLDLGGKGFIGIEQELSSLVWLKKLILWNSKIKDLSFLKHLVDLEELDLTFNEIGDIIPVGNCKKLKIG